MNIYKKSNVILSKAKDLSEMTRWSLLLFVGVLIGVSIVLFTHKTIAQEQNQQAYDVACEVFDVASLKECVQKAKNKEVDLIKITKIVECTSKEDCASDLSNLDHGVKIYGISNTETGFRRTQNFAYSLFTFKNAKDIVIGSFLIDDTSEGDCSGSGNACPPAILIENSVNSTVDQLKTISIKNISLSIGASGGITIKNSVFSNSGNHSVVVTNGTGSSSNILIENNTFSDSSANALLFAASAGKNIIRSNTFEHNHKNALYANCVGVCTASQLRILPNTKDILIEKNIIKNAAIDTYSAFGLYASGIEIAPENVELATVNCNKIFGNTGNGIVVPNRTASTKQIIMKQNAVYDNGINVNFYLSPQDQVDNNCFGSACTVSGC